MNLVPGHAEELRRSGLTDETIARANLYSATGPGVRELLGFGAGPGLVFPYPELNGSGPYARVKLDATPPDGKRYRSPKGRPNRLYIPPLLDHAVLTDARTPLWITEGEKKALKACQEGLPCVAVPGVWSWKTRDTRDRSIPIPDLEHVVWRGRTVLVVYDSDVATKPKVRLAECGLAKELQCHGATVKAVRLPSGAGGAKVGLDDYLLTHSVEALCAIEPVDILDPAGRPIGEAATVLERDAPRAAQPPPAPDPLVTRDGEAIVLTWPAETLIVTVSGFHDGSEGVSAEVLVEQSAVELHWGRLALASTHQRVTLTNKLHKQAPHVDWSARFERVCRIAVATWRAGDPLVALVPRIHDLGERFALGPILPRGQTALLYAHGGGGKSLLGLLSAVCLITGRPIAGLQPYLTGPVLYTDWESTQDEHETRLALLAAGLGLDPGSLLERLYYRPMAGRLADDARRLRQDVARLGAVLVVVDSVVPAAGPEAEGSEAAVRLMGVLRSLGPRVSRLLLGHVPKGEVVQGGPTYPFGSVFYWNLSRSVWELRSDDEDREHLRVSLTHKKVNAGPKHPTFGLDVHFQPDRIAVAALDLAGEPALTRSASQGERAMLALQSGDLTNKALAAILETSEAVAGAVGRRLSGRGRVRRVPLTTPDPDGCTFRWSLVPTRNGTPA